MERRFVENLDKADEVAVYAKLPRGFYIPTPVGKYSPDWAIAFKEGKSSTYISLLKPKEQMKVLNWTLWSRQKLNVPRSFLKSFPMAKCITVK